jgi:signal transduction histidine kinase
VVKYIVEGHGGQISIEDRPGGGSIFWITLPLAERSDDENFGRR